MLMEESIRILLAAFFGRVSFVFRGKKRRSRWKRTYVSDYDVRYYDYYELRFPSFFCFVFLEGNTILFYDNDTVIIYI